MLLRFTYILSLVIVCSSMSTLTMENTADGTSGAKTLMRKATSDESLQSAQEPQGSYTEKKKQYAFFRVFPDSTSVRSAYVQDNQEVITHLTTLPFVTTKKVTVEETAQQRLQSTTTEYSLDIRPLEATLKRGILQAEIPQIIERTKAAEQNKLSFVQRNPTKSILMALAIGASLPFVLPELIRRANL